MELRTYTRAWHGIEWALYKIGDVVLPRPVPIVGGLLTLVGGWLWFRLLSALGLHFAPVLPGVVYLAPIVAVIAVFRRATLDEMPMAWWARAQLHAAVPYLQDRAAMRVGRNRLRERAVIRWEP